MQMDPFSNTFRHNDTGRAFLSFCVHIGVIKKRMQGDDIGQLDSCGLCGKDMMLWTDRIWDHLENVHEEYIAMYRLFGIGSVPWDKDEPLFED